MKIKIKKLLGKGLHFKKGSKRQTIYPSRDWATAFFSFLCLNLVLTALLALVYFDMGRDEDSFDLKVESTPLFERDLFDERLTQYQEKDEKLNLLLSERLQTIDPSI
jgi:hypothetical protein